MSGKIMQPIDFIRARVIEDNATGRYQGRVHTRFPPEPNGYLHIGHVKALCIDFDIALEFGGMCNLRFDDTNPTKEEQEYVDVIQRDIQWLGYQWDGLYYASDYFEQLYQWAVQLIQQGDAYVDDLSAEEIRQHRGNLTEAGRNSPYRDRSVAENLDLFQRMRKGEFPEGARTLRAKIDMASPNLVMRDPVMYRILYAEHHRTGNDWCLYPMYDWAHGQSDSIEGITHSLCSLEYEIHRPLYDWFLQRLGIYAPQQMEFARLELTYTLTSKRKLLQLVSEGFVTGWTDPRMPTISGMRRRGFTARALRNFCAAIGVAKSNSTIDIAQLEHTVRDDLNTITPRVMAVLDPLKVIITNYPAEQEEWFAVPDYPQDKERGDLRQVPFSRELWIERDDFVEVPPKGYKRLSLGQEVRFVGAYFVRADSVEKDENGRITTVYCSYDPETKGGTSADKRKVQGTIHWVSARHSLPAELRLYDRLFLTADPTEGGDFIANLNPNSLSIIANAQIELGLGQAQPQDRFQFMRQGYFCVDEASSAEHLIFNRTIGLRDSWNPSN